MEGGTTFQVSDFKLGAKEKIGDVETRVIEYTVTVKGMNVAVWLGAIEKTFALCASEMDLSSIERGLRSWRTH